jgi:hypothetical protein
LEKRFRPIRQKPDLFFKRAYDQAGLDGNKIHCSNDSEKSIKRKTAAICPTYDFPQTAIRIGVQP